MKASRFGYWAFKKIFIYVVIFGCAGSLLLCVGSCLVAVSTGYSLVGMCGLLTAVASLVVVHRLWGTGASGVVAPGF